MIDPVLLSVAVVVMLTAALAYRRTGDPLTPGVFLAPMLFYVYFYHPLTLYSNNAIQSVFNDPEVLRLPNCVNLIGVVAFCIGACYVRKDPRSLDRSFAVFG